MRSQGSEPFALLYDDALRLLLFGGKGGVGKTTVAAAFSLYLSDRYAQKQFLVISTDPAHSLSDCFDDRLGPVPGPVCGRANLSGMEINADQLFASFRAENGPALRKILRRGTYLDEEDLARFLELSFPGLDEVMALTKIIDLVEGADYDLVIVDTAPTGHTLRLLNLPALMRRWTSFLDILMAKHRYMARVYARSYKPDEADAFIVGLTADILGIQRLLRDERRCRFVPVALAEPVVLAETQRLLSTLVKTNISVREVFINQILSPAVHCERCHATQGIQHAHVAAFRQEWPGLRFVLVPAFSQEVRGQEGLRALAAQARASVAVTDGQAASPPVCGAMPQAHKVLPARIPAPERTAQIFAFCGKGGVGKTTLASAFALILSRRFPQKRVLLFSTDPAHSLSDCLGERIGPHQTRLAHRKNLFAVEIDSLSLFNAFKEAYAQQIKDLFEGLSRHACVDIRFEREVLTNLLDLAPPGLDEIMALVELADYLDGELYDLYVLDLAPTGHALRFLELPELIHDWIRAFFEIILRHRNVIRLPEISELLVEMSKKVRKIQKMLANTQKSEYIPVAVPTELALRETGRLASHLARAKLPVRRLVVNRVLAQDDGCEHCDTLATEHQRMLHRFAEAFPDLELVVLPEVSGELKGADTLSGLMRFA